MSIKREVKCISGGVASVKSTTRVMSFTSGKGGVGKTHTVINVAIALANKGRSVLVLDADLGLANIDVMLGCKIKYTLNDFFQERKSLEDIIVNGPEGISIIPAASGIESVVNMHSDKRVQLLEAIEEIAWQYDYLLIDTPAGIGSDVMFFNSASTEIVCIISSDPTSLTDAYALIKILSRSYGEKSINVVVNNVRNKLQAKNAFSRLERAVGRFLQVDLKYYGYVPTDEAVNDAISASKALLVEYPSSAAARSISSITEKLDADYHCFKVKGGMQFFFKQLLDVSGYGR